MDEKWSQQLNLNQSWAKTEYLKDLCKNCHNVANILYKFQKYKKNNNNF